MHRILILSVALLACSIAASAQQNGTFRKLTITDSLKLRGISIRDIKLNFTGTSHYNLATQQATYDLVQSNKNHVWLITNLSDTTGVTSEIEGDIAYVSSGDTLAIRDSLYWLVFTGGGGGGGGTFDDWTAAADSGTPAVVSDGETVTFSGGTGLSSAISGNTVTTNLDNTAVSAGSYGSATQVPGYTVDAQGRLTAASNTSIQIAQSQVTGLVDSINTHPSGSGTNFRIPRWTGTGTLGSSTLLQSATGQTLDANLAFRITGGTTASRPTGANGMMYFNTNNGWLDIYSGAAWYQPLVSATATGAGTAERVFYANASGFATANDLFAWNETSNYLGIGTASPAAGLHVAGTTNDGATMFCTNSLESGYTRFQLNNSTGAKGYFTIYGNTFVTTGVRNYVVSASSASPFILATDFDATNGGTSPLLFYTGGNASTQERMRITSTGSVGIGTTTPTNLLDIKSTGASANAIATITSTGTGATNGYAYVGYGTNAGAARWSVGTAGSGETFYGVADDFFWLSDALRMVLTRTGSLGIGNSAPARTLHVTGEARITDLTTDTPTQFVGADADGDLGGITPGYGLTLASGGVRVDTAALKAQYVPKTLSGNFELNTAGQSLYIRDAGAYPYAFWNSSAFVAASDINTFIQVGGTSGWFEANAATRAFISSAGSAEMQAATELRLDADSLVLDGLYPVGTTSDSVLVRDGTTGRVNLRKQHTAGAGIELSSGGVISASQSFFNDYDSSIALAGVTTTPDTLDAASNVKSNDWGFNPTTNTYTYNGTTGRYYKVSISAQVDAAGGTEDFYLDVYRNGSITNARAQVTTAVVIFRTLHGQDVLLLSNGDTINVKVSCTAAGGEDFTLSNYSLIVEQI